MAGTPDGGIDKAEIKKLLIRSKKEPVNCAVGLDKSAQAVISLHKIKQPRAVLKDLEDDFGVVKNPRWGTASVDVDTDPKLVILTLNKSAPGFARKMKKTLKGTGFVKVMIRLDDGSIDEMEDEDEEDAAPAVPATDAAPPPADPPPSPPPVAETVAPPPPPAQAAAAEPVTPGPATPGPAAPGLDFGALSRRLADLVKRMIQANPAHRDALKGFATQAQAAIRAMDPAAPQAVDRFEAALNGDMAPTSAAPAAPPPPQSPVADAATFPKARTAWVSARKRVQGEIDKLHAEMAAIYQGHGFGADLDRLIHAKVEPMMAALDDSLAHKLDEVAAASDAAQHTRLVAEARKIIASYAAFIDGEPLIAKLDANPFVPLHIRVTLDATLSTLSKVLSHA